MYKNIETLLNQSKLLNMPLERIILENEMLLTGLSEELIYNKLEQHYLVMKESAAKALDNPQNMLGSLIKGQSKKQKNYSADDTLSGSFINKIMAMALSSSEVNAGMGCICAAPTAGACGILPAVLIGVSENLGSSREQVLNALLIAGGLGAIIARNATLSGAEGGCQAECGAAAAMAAGCAVYLKGGTAEMMANAVAIALINCMGLVCDPVAGLVQLPCSFRNASQSVNALISADMALAGQESVIPADEIINSMYRVGKHLPLELKETSLGGIATSKTGKKISDKIFKGMKKLYE